MSRAPRRRVGGSSAAAVVLSVVLALLSGCVALPDQGPVQGRAEDGQPDPDNAPYFDPPGPTLGATPVDIVEDFLLSMTANPLTTATARKYLTAEAASRWAPERGTVIYGSKTLTTPSSTRTAATETSVSMRLTDTSQLDERGSWLGAAAVDLRSHVLRLVREKGEWRIADPPDVLFVPQTHFESFFRPFSLYFFDKSAQVLVPEPVYVPRGIQAPTFLVKGLLQGPDRTRGDITRTFIPARAEVDLSVPVRRDGTAEVSLSEEVLEIGQDGLRLAAAQLVWTLRQVTGVRAVRITAGGSPLELPGVETEQDIESWAEFDPRVNWASEELFGLREGRVVTLIAGEERRIAGLFGSEAVGLRQIAVDLAAEQVAGVSLDGGRVLVAPRIRTASDEPDDEVPQVVYSGGDDLLVPSWDLFGQLWTIDRTPRGARLSVTRSGVTTELTSAGLTGRRVKAFQVSRDGTRLAAIVAGRGRDDVVLARIVRREDGVVRRVTTARKMPLGDLEVGELRDLAWRTPESLAVLTGPTSAVSQVVIARIDGSSATGDVASNTEIFRSAADQVITAPASGAPLYVGTAGGQLFELAATGRWTGTSVEPGLISPTFVG